MKKALFLLLILPAISNAQFKDILKKATDKVTAAAKTNNTLDIAAGLKEALNKGIADKYRN